ncbi:hypothetical protein GGE12_007170 [Rhizobium mongolense]|uniref:Uncharacterized protein n=1 Tax=Rhizobium mongolense TaxID=57676 RepID=A0A7W6RVG1_9HYPH|nr:hypothetical protein [Rhizobium mongolense]
MTAARCTAVVCPASRNAAAASSRPSQGACCRTCRSFQACGAQHRRQTLGLAQHDAPFLEALVFVPVEIVDQRVLGPSAFGGAGLPRLFDRGVRSGQHRIDRGEFLRKRAGIVIALLPLPSSSRVDIPRGAFDLDDAFATR